MPCDPAFEGFPWEVRAREQRLVPLLLLTEAKPASRREIRQGHDDEPKPPAALLLGTVPQRTALAPVTARGGSHCNLALPSRPLASRHYRTTRAGCCWVRGGFGAAISSACVQILRKALVIGSRTSQMIISSLTGVGPRAVLGRLRKEGGRLT